MHRFYERCLCREDVEPGVRTIGYSPKRRLSDRFHEEDARQVRFTSNDVEQVESTWQEFVPSATLQNVDPRRFRFDWHSAELPGVTLVDYELAAQVHSRAEPENQLLVCHVAAPDGQIWSGRGPIDADAPWLSDGAGVEARWGRTARVRALVFDRETAQSQVRQMTGEDHIDLRAAGLTPHGSADASRWKAMYAYLDAALGDDDGGGALLRAELARHALVLTLASFPTSFTDALRQPAQRAAAPATVRRALAFIDENAHRSITIDDVAAAAFISTRGLQYAFRRALEITPTEALRRARLEGAHRDLLAGEGHSVRAVAHRWGFSNSSRFAVAYRAAYGRPPVVSRS